MEVEVDAVWSMWQSSVSQMCTLYHTTDYSIKYSHAGDLPNNVSCKSYYMSNRQSCKWNMPGQRHDCWEFAKSLQYFLIASSKSPFKMNADRLFKPRLQARQRLWLVSAFCACSARILWLIVLCLGRKHVALKPAHARLYFLMISLIWPGSALLRPLASEHAPRPHALTPT